MDIYFSVVVGVLMHHSYYGRYIPQLEVFLGGKTAPRLTDIARGFHTTGGWPLIGHGVLTINNSQMTVLQTLVTERQPPLTHLQRNDQYLNSPYVAVLH